MKKIMLIGFVAALVLVSFSGCSKKENEESAVSSQQTSSVIVEKGSVTDGIYVSPDNQFRFRVPDGWDIIRNNVQDSANGIIIGPSNYTDTGISLNLSISPLPTKEEQNWTREKFQETYQTIFPDLEIKTFDKTAIRGMLTVHVAYTYHPSKESVSYGYQYMISGKQTYTMTFVSNSNSDDLVSQFDKCARSFEEI